MKDSFDNFKTMSIKALDDLTSEIKNNRSEAIIEHLDE